MLLCLLIVYLTKGCRNLYITRTSNCAALDMGTTTASSGFGPSDIEFLHKDVFEGIWENYEEPAYSRLIWTLQTSHSFFIMAIFVVFIEFIGSRSWVICRYVVLHITGKPVRLTDGVPLEPLLRLSRGRAIWISLPSIGQTCVRLLTRLRIFRPSMTGQMSRTPHDDPAQSIWFGIVAIFNLTIFIIMGIAIPALLTDGAFGAPVVKSKAVEECLTSSPSRGWMGYVLGLPRTDAIFQQCFGQANKGCDSQYYLASPTIQKRRLDLCPFPGEICQNQTKPFEISHMNISPHEVGINSPSKLTLNHRLTCAPIIVEKFQLYPSSSSNYSYVSARTPLDIPSFHHIYWKYFAIQLSTVNGPNFASKESSGLQMAWENGPTDVTVLPRYGKPSDLSISEYQEIIHEDLRRDDGQSFLIVYRAGRSLYYSAVEDPFFAAHNRYYDSEDPDPYFLPDYEATALGCLEQVQFCIPRLSGPIFCTSWGHRYAPFDQLQEFLISGLAGIDQAIFANSEQIAFVFPLTEAFSVYYYLALRNWWHNLSLLLRAQTSSDRGSYSVDEPWTLEVETWFMKAIVNAIFRMRMGAKYNFNNFTLFGKPYSEKKFLQQWATCGRVLFRDGDYTNINWVGFCTTTAALLIICFISYFIEQIHKGGIILFKFLADQYRMVVKICSISGCLIHNLRFKSWRGMAAIVPPLRDFWQTGWFSGVSRPRPTQYRNWPSEESAYTRGSGNFNIDSAQFSYQDFQYYDLGDIHDLEVIDNPIL